LHRLIYGQNDTFYNQWMHSANHSLGAFCSGGTIANITALWVARNKALRANGSFKGVEKEGLFKAMKHYGYDGLAVLVSERGHYSLKKAADVLGLGQEGLVAVKTDANNRIIIDDLKAKIVELEKQNIKPIAVIGVAGTTETGNVDPLPEIAEVCQAHGCHFHVDAAWGGA
ncbi:aminotransferase class V-fold PLP-dependent enzyme, partial [Vibrio parahaemolyticus]|nr:aminotransferase class V-fold PLP-dependent enzyme [Vibrio parahaemolyticus]